MRSFQCVIILIFIVFPGMAQDERTLRKMLSGQMNDNKKKAPKDLIYTASTPRYYFDVNNDGKEESFFFSSEDGKDWLTIKDYRGREIYRYRFINVGTGANVYRVSLKWVNKNTSVAIFHYFEGRTQYLDKRGTSRLYFLAFQKGQLKNLKMSRGPHIWDEYLDHRKHYHRRNYKIGMFDYDLDGKREITVKFNTIARVYRLSKGEWYPYPERPGREIYKSDVKIYDALENESF